jgi:peptidoglycan/xylan/chitin deacetylase (PgdA/CDA1 family)
MSFMPRLDAATTAEWADLVAELDHWGEAGRVATLWWRDDDAVAATTKLDALLRLAPEVPLALAVIPADARPDLAAALVPFPQVAVLQHGWRHANHAASGKKSEFPPSRSAVEVTAELAAGHARLIELFGSRALPVLVPPWNRFAAEFLPLLAEAGIVGLSAMASREVAALPYGIARIDVHVDLVAWKRDRGFIGTSAALAGLVGNLRVRRRQYFADGTADPDAATGILTHQLVMDRATAGFLDRLTALVDRHGAARWVSAAELLAR